jgi:putative serine/threonine protein kinase
MIGLDHGELSRMPKHVIVGKKITIIDFESSSMERRVSNVTSATQAFFIGSGISKTVKGVYKIPEKKKIINVLRRYKQDQSRKSFESLLNVLKI